ncbi:MAG: hypothetical protein ISS52_05820 [Dehalococcoidia bacterium]|nr:hypothetical protein [Dehalococcoidia bacterium]
MTRQIYSEEVEIDTEITPLIKDTSKRFSAKWAGVCGDYDEYHYDDTIARERGFPGAIVNGKLLVACLTQMMTNWIGARGLLKRIACQYRRFHPVGERLICRGRVTNTHVKDHEHLVECEIWIESPTGERRTLGSATVGLPSKSQS